MLKEIHHRVKNNLQIIVSLLRMQGDRITAPDALVLFTEAQNRVQSMALIHDLLYQSPDLSRLPFGEYVRSLVKRLYQTYQTSTERVQLVLETLDLSLELDTAIPCGLIINELVTNALKYAFPDARKGMLIVRLELLNDGASPRGRLTVRDDGIGMPPDFQLQESGSMGLLIVQSLVSQIRGSLALEQTQGTAFQILFPIV